MAHHTHLSVIFNIAQTIIKILVVHKVQQRDKSAGATFPVLNRNFSVDTGLQIFRFSRHYYKSWEHLTAKLNHTFKSIFARRIPARYPCSAQFTRSMSRNFSTSEWLATVPPGRLIGTRLILIVAHRTRPTRRPPNFQI
jgi:hypothetical protein